MYKIQNVTGSNISLTLERGAITLRPGQYFDLEPHCSRAWMAKNRDLNVFLKSKKIRITHDSQATISNVTVKAFVNPAPKRPVVEVRPIGKVTPVAPKVIDVPSPMPMPVTPVPVKPNETITLVLEPSSPSPEEPVDLPTVDEYGNNLANTKWRQTATPTLPEVVSYDPVEEHLKKIAESTAKEDDEEEDDNDEDDEDY